MIFIQNELDRIQKALQQFNHAPQYDQLYAAQQALGWVLNPEAFKSPYDMLVPPPTIDTPED